MFKFNSENIFVGHVKQLLASFNLPKYHVYTEDQADYHNKYLEAKNNIDTIEAKVIALEQKINAETDETKRAELIRQQHDLRELFKKYELILENSPEKNILMSAIRNVPVTYANRENYQAQVALEIEELDKLISDIEKLLADDNLKPADDPEKLPTDVRKAKLQEKADAEKRLLELRAIQESVEIYPSYMRYIPYIKNNKIQIYAPKVNIDGSITYSDDDWKDCHAVYAKRHDKVHTHGTNLVTPKGYVYDLKIRNYTKNLKIQNNTYDSYTHEYLGDYLRFVRDYNHVNLMSLYNCFSNRLCPKLKIEFNVYTDASGKGGYTASFNTDDTKYKIYMIPIKLFQQYTIAIDNMSDVEMCCGFYSHYQYPEAYNEIAFKTYQCFNSMTFCEPVLFDKVKELNTYLSLTDALEIVQHEQDLKLFIKLPTNNNSSIVVLEGDYTNYTNATLIKYHPTDKSNYEVEQTTIDFQTPVNIGSWYSADFDEDTATLDFQTNDLIHSTTEVAEGATELDIRTYSTQRNTREGRDNNFIVLNNHTELNLDGDVKENLKHLSSPLQLLAQNTKVSYPFADRLIEFLTGNMITSIDPIADNIARAKKVIDARTNSLQTLDGIWEDSMQVLLYNYMSKHYDRLDNYHDILGYVDKDAERIYSNGSISKKETIASANIYDEWED